MDVDAVVRRFGLGEEMRGWLIEAADLPLPEGGCPLPSRSRAPEALAPFALSAQDEAELVGLWPDDAWPPELLWLVERMYARVLEDLSAGRGEWRYWPPLAGVEDARARCAPVFAFAAAVPALRAWQDRRGVPPEVAAATLRDVGRHVGHNRTMFGRVGLEVASWIALQFRGGLYELGRLQYEPARLVEQATVTWYSEEEAAGLAPELAYGAPTLRLHIPAGESLAPGPIDASLSRARGFFASCFGAEYVVATCTSWLLDSQLAEYLPAESNIMAFQRRFTLVDRSSPGDRDVFRFVFRRPDVERLEGLSPATRLERAIVAHLRAGRHWQVRTGWLRLP
ncbi:acyltransferase domain-containing protein [Nocardiopsis rhodophaea]